MAAKRSKTQARRSGKRGGGSGFKWLVAGLLIGGAGFGYLHFRERWEKNASALPTPDPQAHARNSGEDNALAEVPDKPRVKYDFYELLPGREVVIPDAELDAQARAEQQAKIAAAAAAARAATAGTPGATPAAGASAIVPASGPAVAANAASAQVAGTAPAGAPPPVAASAAASNPNAPRFLIQAGAFRGSAEAEALKAKIAMTGEIARVETAQINGNTVHRVRMGPYPDASALAAAKQALASHGIAAQAIRVK
jgi:cell division protein FtsN